MLLDNKSKYKMAVELVESATSKDLKETDWTKNIEICELVSTDPRESKGVIKAIKKRLRNRNPKILLFAVTLLEMLMNNIGESIHRQVIDLELLPILVKMVKKKSDFPAGERIFHLLDATQASFGGASGKFPQYYTAYYDLMSAGVKFPQRIQSTAANNSSGMDINNNSNSGPVSGFSETNENIGRESKAVIIPDPSVLEKASNILDVLRDVLEAADNARNLEAAWDEFTLDLVEQCSFQKQRVMHFAITSRDEKAVSWAAELNDELQKVLTRHDTLLSRKHSSTPTYCNSAHLPVEENLEQLSRLRKGKACVGPGDGNAALSNYAIRPLIPPPPARQAEREKFFQERRYDVGISDRMRGGLSLSSHEASSSHSGSFSSSD